MRGHGRESRRLCHPTLGTPFLSGHEARACRGRVRTDQQVQAVQVRLDVVGVFGGDAPELLQLRTSRLPDDHDEGHHPLDALLYVAPLVPCNDTRQAPSRDRRRLPARTAGDAPETRCISSDEEKW